MKCFIVSVCLAVLCTLPAKTQNSLVASLESSLVKIVVMSPDGKKAIPIGTGFVAGADNLIVTAAHLYWQAGTRINKNKGGSMIAQRISRSGKRFRVPIKLVATVDEHDVAVFTFDPNLAKRQWPEVDIKPLSLAEKEAEMGDDVAFAGYFAGDQYPVLSKGTIAGWTSKPLDQVLIDVHVNRGQSGSPVVLLENGQVVGVAVGFVPVSGVVPTGPAQYSGLSRAAKVEYVKNLVKSRR